MFGTFSRQCFVFSCISFFVFCLARSSCKIFVWDAVRLIFLLERFEVVYFGSLSLCYHVWVILVNGHVLVANIGEWARLSGLFWKMGTLSCFILMNGRDCLDYSGKWARFCGL